MTPKKEREEIRARINIPLASASKRDDFSLYAKPVMGRLLDDVDRLEWALKEIKDYYKCIEESNCPHCIASAAIEEE